MTTDTLEKIDLQKAAQVDYLPLLTPQNIDTVELTDWGQLYILDETQAVPGYTNATASTIMETLTAEMTVMPTQLSPLSSDYWVSMSDSINQLSGSINQMGVTFNNMATELKALIQKAAFDWDEETVDQEGFDAIREQLATALDKLASSGSVADFLRHEGITGVRKAARRCPIARWLSGVLGREVSVRPQAVFVAVRDANGRQLEVEMPIAVRDFVREFDQGVHDDLEQQPAPALVTTVPQPYMIESMSSYQHQVYAVWNAPLMKQSFNIDKSMPLFGALV